MVITEPAVPNSWLFCLGSKLYPSNMQHMLNKDLTPFIFDLFLSMPKLSKWKKALLAGWVFGSCHFKFPVADLLTILIVFHVTLCANTKAGKVSALCSRLHVYVDLLRKCPCPTVPTAPTVIRILGLCLGEPPLGAHNFWILSGNTHIQFYEESQPHVY